MARTRLGFDMGSSSLKVAVLHGESLRVEQVGLPEELTAARAESPRKFLTIKESAVL